MELIALEANPSGHMV